MINIESTEVKTNDNGMYCLNDLHKASGNDEKNKPKEFMRLESTKRISNEILKGGITPFEVLSGRYGGTFVSHQLVYAYAMWISPEFNLKVINAFHDMSMVESTLDNAVANVRTHGKNFSQLMSQSAKDIEELKTHGKHWGAYGHKIKVAKKEMMTELKKIQNDVQLKIELIGGE